jgi:predicted PurR-regulated permease PerM
VETDETTSPDLPRMPGVWTILQGLTALLVLSLYLLGLREALNPFLLFALLVAVLHPFRNQDGYALVLGVGALLLLYWVLDTTGFLLAPFILALGLAYVLDPATDRLQELGVPRSLGILLLALPVVGGLTVLLVLGIPALGDQIAQLIEQAPVLLERFADWVDALDERVAALSLPAAAQAWVDQLRDVDSEAVVEMLRARQEEIAQSIWSGVLGLGRGLGSALSILGYVVLTPVLTFYLLRDWDGLTAALRDLLPPQRRGPVVEFFREYDTLLSQYLRGQFTVALTVGTITAVGLWIWSFPYAFLIGVIVAVFSVVPYLGLAISLLPAIIIALLSGNVLYSFLKIAVVYGVAQGLEGAVISPRIVGDSVGLHPVWVVLALSVGGYFFGFVGLLLGVPMAVGVKLLVVRGLRRYRASAVYGTAAGTTPDAG